VIASQNALPMLRWKVKEGQHLDSQTLKRYYSSWWCIPFGWFDVLQQASQTDEPLQFKWRNIKFNPNSSLANVFLWQGNSSR
tara:strand:+ start:393 stop:638 length:246 start_codon:yes stop_codon:yes gene_type:complete